MTCTEEERYNNTVVIICTYNIIRTCDHICINQAYATKVEFSAGAKVVNTLPFYAYISKSENPNNFTVESLNKKLKTSAYSVYKSLFNGILISEFIKCAICLVYANMVTHNERNSVVVTQDQGVQ